MIQCFILQRQVGRVKYINPGQPLNPSNQSDPSSIHKLSGGSWDNEIKCIFFGPLREQFLESVSWLPGKPPLEFISSSIADSGNCSHGWMDLPLTRKLFSHLFHFLHLLEETAHGVYVFIARALTRIHVKSWAYYRTNSLFESSQIQINNNNSEHIGKFHYNPSKSEVGCPFVLTHSWGNNSLTQMPAIPWHAL